MQRKSMPSAGLRRDSAEIHFWTLPAIRSLPIPSLKVLGSWIPTKSLRPTLRLRGRCRKIVTQRRKGDESPLVLKKNGSAKMTWERKSAGTQDKLATMCRGRRADPWETVNRERQTHLPEKEKGTATPQNQPEVLSLFQPTPLRSQYLCPRIRGNLGSSS
jgi:hypothetical protein